VVEVLLCPVQSAAANYAFDVTPARLVTGLITERGFCVCWSVCVCAARSVGGRQGICLSVARAGTGSERPFGVSPYIAALAEERLRCQHALPHRFGDSSLTRRPPVTTCRVVSTHRACSHAVARHLKPCVFPAGVCEAHEAAVLELFPEKRT
jgi:hypothetical protein